MDAKVSHSVHTTDEARRLRRKRYGFETRFRLLGATAVLLAVTALFALLWTVVGKATGALTETYVVLPVKLEKDKIDPKGTDDPSAIRRADFDGVVRAALKEAIPEVKGRRNRRALYGLLSDGAAIQLKHKVMANPALIGTTQTAPLLASDDVDLFMKGYDGKFKVEDGNGIATATGTTGTIKVIVEANAFNDVLLMVKETLRDQAARLERDASAQQRGVDAFENALVEATTDDQRKRAQDRISAYTQKRDGLLEQAKGLIARADNPGGVEGLSSDLPSIFVRINGGVVVADRVSTDTIEGDVILPLSSTKSVQSGQWQLLKLTPGEAARRISDKQAIWVRELEREENIKQSFNWKFFSASDSREPEMAGVWGAIVGSFWTMLVTFLLSFPIGVLAAIYLEEFAPKNRFADFIEVNINNLAAVPSIVFGLLGLVVFLGFFGVPRSAPLAGGIVLALMTLPTIIIASRAAIKAVPPSIREAALGVGASKVQSVFHHVLPLAMPGILTGTIIGMAQALGETAPLLMIGMVAFIRDIPTGILEPATVLPVQIFSWSDFPERAFEMRTALAIVVLLIFLVAMNAIAIMLRRRFERRW